MSNEPNNEISFTRLARQMEDARIALDACIQVAKDAGFNVAITTTDPMHTSMDRCIFIQLGVKL